MTAQTFQDLVVWQKAHSLVLEVYRLTSAFPAEEKYGLISQMRRAGVSIPANIAEGFKKHGKLDKIRMLNIAQGSIEEVRYYLILTKDLQYHSSNHLFAALDEVGRLLDSYIKAIKNSEYNFNLLARSTIFCVLSSMFYLLYTFS